MEPLDRRAGIRHALERVFLPLVVITLLALGSLPGAGASDRAPTGSGPGPEAQATFPPGQPIQPIPLFRTISGRVALSDGTGAQIVMRVSENGGAGRNFFTNTDGTYAISVGLQATAVITPSNSGFTYSPASRTIRPSDPSNNVNFTATYVRTTFNLSGTITRQRFTEQDVNPFIEGEGGVTVTLRYRGNTVAQTVTNSAGTYQFSNVPNMPGGNAILSPAKGAGLITFDDQFEILSTPVANASLTRDFEAVRQPVIIVGGFSVISLPDLDCPQIGANGETYFPGTCGPNALDDFDEDLAANGWSVFFLPENVSLLGGRSLNYHLTLIRQKITAVRQKTGASKVILLGLSGGGVISRVYVEDASFDNRRDVSHVYTLGSSHLGLPADILGVPTMIAIFPALFSGANTTEAILAIAASLVENIPEFLEDLILTFLCPNQPMICSFGRQRMADLNASRPVRTTVQYHLIHGNAITGQTASNTDGRFTIIGDAFHSAVLANVGTNDALVPTDGANLRGTHDRLFTTEIHGEPLGSPWYSKPDGSPASPTMVNCLRPVFIQQSKINCGTVSTTTVARGPEDEADEEQLRVGRISADELVPIRLPNMNVTLQTGEEVTRTVPVESGEVSFSATWLTGTLELSLKTPDGTTILTPLIPSGVEVVSSPFGTIYRIEKPTPGTYTMRLRAIAAPPGGAQASLSAILATSYQFSAGRNRNWVDRGAPIVFSATVSSNVQDPVVTATLRQVISPTQQLVTTTIPLLPTGLGTFRAVYTVPITTPTGYVDTLFRLTGKDAGGKEIEREQRSRFEIYGTGFKLSGGIGLPNGLRTSLAGPERLDALTVTIGITNTAPGDFKVGGILVTLDGKEVARANVRVSLTSAGPTAVDLRFAGDEIFASGLDGPYRLSRVIVTDERTTGFVTADTLLDPGAEIAAVNAFQTPAYRVSQFAPVGPVYIPGAGAGYVVP